MDRLTTNLPFEYVYTYEVVTLFLNEREKKKIKSNLSLLHTLYNKLFTHL
jgi:hypothetical protein